MKCNSVLMKFVLLTVLLVASLAALPARAATVYYQSGTTTSDYMYFPVILTAGTYTVTFTCTETSGTGFLANNSNIYIYDFSDDTYIYTGCGTGTGIQQSFKTEYGIYNIQTHVQTNEAGCTYQSNGCHYSYSLTIDEGIVTTEPTKEVTAEVTAEPTKEVTAEVTSEPTKEVTAAPTEEVTAEPTSEPTKEVTAVPTEEVTSEPTSEPTTEVTSEPTATDIPPEVIAPAPVIATPAPVAPTPPPAAACGDVNFDAEGMVRTHFTNDGDRGSINCRVIASGGDYMNWLGGQSTFPSMIGNEVVLKLGVVGAIDVFSPSGVTGFMGDVDICLKGTGYMIYMNAANSPRVPQLWSAWTTPAFPGYTCTTLYAPGTVILVKNHP